MLSGNNSFICIHLLIFHFSLQTCALSNFENSVYRNTSDFHEQVMPQCIPDDQMYGIKTGSKHESNCE